jgi:hypothetical protein
MNDKEHRISPPRKMTGREQLTFGVKLGAIAGLVVLLLWLADLAV